MILFILSYYVFLLVYAINSLYGALNFPPLAGWLPIGGDPCGLGWQGVQCVNANITGMYEYLSHFSVIVEAVLVANLLSFLIGRILNGANLGGQLSEDLSFFASIIQM